MPIWGPWEFSWAWFLTASLGLWWYWRGVFRMAPEERPPLWRSALYVAGVLAIYAVLQTQYEYLALHMFFLNRIQHVAMHHLGPFLIALAWPGAALYRGMPGLVRRIVDWRFWHYPLLVLQQPAIGSILFVGLVGLWLIPAVHFRAMIDPTLYRVMNWSMVVDGLLFWTVVLDMRSQPPARVSFGGRALMAFVVMPPQILIGALIAFSDRDIYPYYDWCGRIFASIGAIDDQQFGGLNAWVPPAMMSVIAFLLVINALRLQEEREERLSGPSHEGGISAGDWTGR
ncbi:cytochrome c oxidase assembly protein [Methyloligella sp. 2.7D]|uniref:cytochrome c oxidase assembly protein n=1 Tax=unclassified Methyloligella TaxID=2625955 RepID=UPI00157CC8B7|nr:cytochrome c oxidase assembly protein [Methyloligella sp. GL2]QKP78087.1 cytochrome c oxidase assembly protein [Methyloligella sp. GL2]